MDELSTKIGFQSKEDWYRITGNDFARYGGRALLDAYGGSPTKLIQSVYPDHDWIIWNFTKIPEMDWKDKTNLQQFVDYLRKKLKINCLDDWYRISEGQIQRISTISPIRKHGGLLQLLAFVYPHHSWNFAKFHNKTMPFKASQRMLMLTLKELFPDIGSIHN